MHFIRKHILRVLTMHKWTRFRDMKPSNVDSNLYNYHLKELIRDDLVERVETKGYRLTPMGLRYVDHVSLESFEPRWQPKLLTKILVTNEEGQILVWPKYKQPFINTWSLPSGKMHYDDETLELAARREISYFTNEITYEIVERGVIEVTVYIEGEMVTHAIEHLFSMKLASINMNHAKAEWKSLQELERLKCSPGTKEILQLLHDNEAFAHASMRIDW